MEAKVDNTLRWRLMPSEARLKIFWNSKNKQTFHFNNHSQIFSLCLNFSLCYRKIFSLCLKIFPCVKAKFPVFSLSGKSKNQIPCFPCFPCAVATLTNLKVETYAQKPLSSPATPRPSPGMLPSSTISSGPFSRSASLNRGYDDNPLLTCCFPITMSSMKRKE